MHVLRRWLLNAYYHGTKPYRFLDNARLARRGQLPICVLFYHRIADEFPNDWTLSRSTFARQISWLQKNCELISLAEVQRRLETQTSCRPAVSITFDDGYEDNCRYALPLLVRERIPFTYFVSLKYIEHGLPFPHDVRNSRSLRPNSVEQIQTLAAEETIEIGAHTHNHPDLAKIHNPSELYDEVVGVRHELESMINREIQYFAFPYGQRSNLNAEVFQLARDHGYAGICSAYGGYNVPAGDPFHIHRLHADPSFTRFVNWVTIDPRLRLFVRQFEAAPPQSVSVAHDIGQEVPAG